MKNKNLLAIILSLLAILLTQLACGSSNTGEKVGESEGTTAVAPQIEVYKAGDIIKVDDYTITLETTEIQGSKLIANFVVDNSAGTKEITISSLMSFEAKDSEGNKLSTAFCDGSGLDGSVLVGDKLRGSICWDGVLEGATLKIYYEPSLFGSGAIVWEVGK